MDLQIYPGDVKTGHDLSLNYDLCVCCGKMVPEGFQVCGACYLDNELPHKNCNNLSEINKMLILLDRDNEVNRIKEGDENE